MAEAARRSDIERTGKVFYHTSLSRRPSGHLLRMKKSQQKQERQRHRRSDWETKGNHYLTLSYHKRCYVFTSFSNSALTFRTLYRPDQNATDSVFLSSSFSIIIIMSIPSALIVWQLKRPRPILSIPLLWIHTILRFQLVIVVWGPEAQVHVATLARSLCHVCSISRDLFFPSKAVVATVQFHFVI